MINFSTAVHTEMTQRERLSEQLDKGTLECLVCCERVKQIDSVWSCSNCYHVLHLRCIRKWAMSSVVGMFLLNVQNLVCRFLCFMSFISV